MYIVNGICYAGNNLEEIRVQEALPLRGGNLLLQSSSAYYEMEDFEGE